MLSQTDKKELKKAMAQRNHALPVQQVNGVWTSPETNVATSGVESKRYPFGMMDAEVEALRHYMKRHRDGQFVDILYQMMEEKGMSEVTLYKRAGMDRRHFSKIRTQADYRPNKQTVVALALALRCDQKEADRLLHSLGYAFSASNTFDLVIQFCIEREIYDLEDVNDALSELGLPMLGSDTF